MRFGNAHLGVVDRVDRFDVRELRLVDGGVCGNDLGGSEIPRDAGRREELLGDEDEAECSVCHDDSFSEAERIGGVRTLSGQFISCGRFE